MLAKCVKCRALAVKVDFDDYKKYEQCENCGFEFVGVVAPKQVKAGGLLNGLKIGVKLWNVV